MRSHQNYSEAEALERYRIALENATNQSSIYTILSEFGYDKSALSEGKKVYDETLNAYDSNKKETNEASVVYRNFSAESEALFNAYFLHRKKARVIFRKEPEILIRLGVNGRQRTTYVKLMENVRRFYSEITADEDLQKSLLRLKVTAEEIQQAQEKISTVEQLRADYLKEKGESQDATQQKDEAFSKMDDWMSEFYAVARIAMEDNPQLLESLGKIVKR
jgi:hypothetical protein